MRNKKSKRKVLKLIKSQPGDFRNNDSAIVRPRQNRLLNEPFAHKLKTAGWNSGEIKKGEKHWWKTF